MKRVGERKKKREKEKECLRERKENERERVRRGRKQNGLAVPHNNSNAQMRETTFIEIIYPLYLIILSNNI